MYIDARQEKFQLGDAKQVIYIIKQVAEDHVKQRIYDCIGLHTLKIEVIPASEKVIVTYYENIISPSFMDYQFQLKKLDFKRVESLI